MRLVLPLGSFVTQLLIKIQMYQTRKHTSSEVLRKISKNIQSYARIKRYFHI